MCKAIGRFTLHQCQNDHLISSVVW
uniref:Uncharacterized protein n=1 Tax=Arundo donax TaxID=35708 RepID=A0A0A8ZU91_ARUDO